MPDPIKSKYKKALELIAKEKGFDPKLFKEYQAHVRYLESKGDYKAIQKPRKGYKSAPGRGAYQYEVSDFGGSGSSSTALTRARRWAKRNNFELPEDLNEDFSKMSKESQDLVDLINYRESPTGDFDLIKNKDYKTAYLNHHWAGPKEEYDKKAEYYDKSIAHMNKYKKEMALGGFLKALQLGSSVASDIRGAKNELEAEKMRIKKQANPYGIMKNGGDLESEGMKNYVGKSHEEGGIDINPDGSIGPNGPEVEGDEKAYTFKVVNKGKTYVYPKKMKKLIEAIEKKYKDNNLIDQASKEMELKKLADKNEKEKSADNVDKLRPGGYPDPAFIYEQMVKGRTVPEIKTIKSEGIPIPKRQIIDPVKKPNKKIKLPDLDPSIETLSNIKIATDTLSALGGTGKTPRRYNPNEAEVERLAKSTLQFDNTAIRNMILGQTNASVNQIRNSNRGSGVVNANIANILNNSSNRLADSKLQENIAKISAKTNAATILQKTGADRAAEDVRADITDDQNTAGALNSISQSFQDAIEVKKYINNLDIADKNLTANLKAIEAKYPNFSAEDFLLKLKNASTPEEKKAIKEEALLKFN